MPRSEPLTRWFSLRRRGTTKWQHREELSCRRKNISVLKKKKREWSAPGNSQFRFESASKVSWSERNKYIFILKQWHLAINRRTVVANWNILKKVCVTHLNSWEQIYYSGCTHQINQTFYLELISTHISLVLIFNVLIDLVKVTPRTLPSVSSFSSHSPKDHSIRLTHCTWHTKKEKVMENPKRMETKLKLTF